EWYRQGHFVVCNDSHAEAIAPCDANFLTYIQVQASLTVAILQANQLWGLLIVHQCAAPHHWQASEIDLLKQLGLQIGIASQKASLYTQLETELAERRRAEQTIAQQVQRERLLRILSQQIRQSLRLEQILETTVTEIQHLLAADRAIIFRLNRDRSGVVIQEANVGRHPVITEMYLTDRHFPQASYDFYLTGQARAVDRTHDDAHAACLLEFMEQIGVKSKLIAPILQTLDDNTPVVWGLLIVHACDEYRHWLPDELSLLQQLATQVGIAIQQANLYSQIKDELAQKKVLLKEIHHRVKNNLQVVSSLLALQADAVQDATVLAALQDSDNRLQAMALIHETLYQSDNLGRLDFSNYIQRLADNILLANSRYLNAINLSYALQPVFLTLDTAIPCGLLLNELVTNAIKHAFPDGQQGTICLTLQPAPTRSTTPPDQSISTANRTIAPTDVLSQAAPRYVLSISDDGIGMPANLDLEKTKSLGLRIASDLAQQLRGSLVLERGNGTQFHLTFTDLSYRKRL
ncbi:MAG TPA: GAF domain-containing protein, partial [Crinalium sp.]